MPFGSATWQRAKSNVGTYLLKIDNRDEALAFFRRALAIREMLAAGKETPRIRNGRSCS